MTTRILRFIFIFSSLLLSLSALASRRDTSNARSRELWNETDKKVFYGMYVYADVIEPCASIFMKNKTDFSAGIDFDLCHTVYPLFEIGYSKFDATGDYRYVVPLSTDYQYLNHGLYYKIGSRFNMLNKNRKKWMVPMLYLGAKFAFSPSYFNIKDALVYNDSWNVNKTYDLNGKGVIKWAEFVFGVRASICKSFCMGFEAELREFVSDGSCNVKTSDGKTIKVKQSYSPGYGDTSAGRWTLRYFLSFCIHGRTKKSESK